VTDQDNLSPAFEIDRRPHQLLEKYTSLTGALLLETAEGLLEFEVPTAEIPHWGRDRVIRIALVPEALDEDPEAELLAVGSPLFERLIAAIRTRGFRQERGVIPPTANSSPEAALLPIRVDGAVAEPAGTELTLLPVGQLLARVSIKAGPRLEERLVESTPVDLSTGAVLLPALIVSLSGSATGESSQIRNATPVNSRPAGELLPLLFARLEKQLETELTRLREEATRDLKAEVDRLERYYTAMLEEVEPDDPDSARNAKSVIRAELDRRKEEEQDRWRMRVTVHPLQLTEWQVPAQRATWLLTTPVARTASLHATRLLVGVADWKIICPTCGAEPRGVRVCREGHAACLECSDHCSVCGEGVCRSHGLANCAAAQHPVCADHVRTCPSCGSVHCTQHSRHCMAADHEVCPACGVLCGRCGKELCQTHATRTSGNAPQGARWLCTDCTVLCEGGTNEPIGLDEAVRCCSCERYICEIHRVACAIDGQPHCSRHLRRSDRSGRLVCESHRAACADEPGSVLATDEVAACATCSLLVCDRHSGTCDADGSRHCGRHLSPLADRPRARGCEQHRSTCHVDMVVFSVVGTRQCPVCGKATCEVHRTACKFCARQVCVRDVEEGRCLTCHRLEETFDPADDLVQAALVANGGEPTKAKSWRTARDATATVVELDLGWTRRLVFTLPHGELRPKTVLQHSATGTRRLR